MAEHPAQPVTLADRNYFLVRRLHSLTGLVPIGVFLCFHLLANSTILFGREHFQTSVERIQLLEPFLVPVEMAFIFIPILFHAILGVKIWLSGHPNTLQYRYGGNIRYMLQRVTGIIALLFILFHVWQLHWLGNRFGGGHFDLGTADVPAAAGTTATAIQSTLWVAPFYALGIVSAVFHLANGIWTALITWGITIGPGAQRLSGRVCIVVGIVFGLLGLVTLSTFRTIDVSVASPPAEAHHSTSGLID